MADDLKLLKVVAFDAKGQAVLTPLNKWKVAYSERNATIDIKCAGYAKQYNLRTDLAAVAPGETREKVSLGKTLGRLALTGMLHGRHAASADLRWGGIDRDQSIGLYLIFQDTTMVSMEVEGDEVEELIKGLPDHTTGQEAYDAAVAQSKRVKAMARDGVRVLDELDAKDAGLQLKLEAARPMVESGATFDERQQAREQSEQLEEQLRHLRQTRVAVIYELSASGQITRPAVSTAVQPDAVAAPAAVAQTAHVQSAKSTPTPISGASAAKRSGASKVVKFFVFIAGALVGLLASLLLLLFLQGMPILGLLQMPVMTIGGGWLAVKMLNALMRR